MAGRAWRGIGRHKRGHAPRFRLEDQVAVVRDAGSVPACPTVHGPVRRALAISVRAHRGPAPVAPAGARAGRAPRSSRAAPARRPARPPRDGAPGRGGAAGRGVSPDRKGGAGQGRAGPPAAKRGTSPARRTPAGRGVSRDRKGGAGQGRAGPPAARRGTGSARRAALGRGASPRTPPLEAPDRREVPLWIDEGSVRNEAERATARAATASPARRRRRLPQDVVDELERAAGRERAPKLQAGWPRRAPPSSPTGTETRRTYWRRWRRRCRTPRRYESYWA